MLRRLFRLLVVLSVVAILGVAAVWIMTNTDFGRERARRFVEGVIGRATHGIVRIGGMRGNLLSGAMLVRVSITDSAGNPFLKADSIYGRYVIRNFASKRLEFTDVVVYRPDVVVSRPPNGEWNYKILWPSDSTPKPPGDTIPGWGDRVILTNATIVDGDVTVKSPWSPRTGLTARVRDSVVKAALDKKSRIDIIEAPGGYQKVVKLLHVNAKLPRVRWADPAFDEKFFQVAALSMDAYPFRPPAAKVTALTGNFEVNDDSLWWKGVGVQMPNSAMKGDGVYFLNNGDLRLSMGATPASFRDFDWLYPHFPENGGGKLGLSVLWRGATQTYIVRDSDLRTDGAHLQGDIGVTISDTVFFHDANVRFSELTTKQIERAAPGITSPRQGVLAGRAKFAGSLGRMDVDADVTFNAYNRGTSRVVADGMVGFTGKEKVVVSARDLRVRIAPLQIDIVKLLFPVLPIGGSLTGVATLNGSGATQLVATGLDIVHRDGPNVSRAVGRASVHTTGKPTLDLDVVARPFALAELTKFAPSLPLKGHATGPVSARGPIDALRIDTRLTLPGGGVFAMRGPIDFLSKELGYDVVTDVTALDLSRVMIKGPVTSLTGGGRARGRGFKPATMYADVAMSFGPSSVDTLGVDSAVVRARIASGLANIDTLRLHVVGGSLDVAGQLGMDAKHSGALRYSLAVDSLGAFARYIPGATNADTGVVRPRPLTAFELLVRARADSARLAKETEVARAIRNEAPATVRIPSDTPRAVPRGVIAGSLVAKGTVTGSIDRFSLDGTASGAGLIVRGNSARRFDATYSWADARTKTSKLIASVRADTVNALGFAFDSVAGDVTYIAPSGTVALRVRQGSERDYGLSGDFTVDKARNELRLRDVALRFDTTTWKSIRPSTIRFGAEGIEVVNLELVSGPGRRIFANGLLPTKGVANFDLEVTDFAVENIAELLQSDLPITGRLNLDAHVTGTSEDPRMSGKLEFLNGTYNLTVVPEIRGTFSYANQQLTTKATATDSTGRVLASVDGTVPINLALSGVTGSRLLDLPMKVSLLSDSLPLSLIPQFTTAVTDVKGRALGNVTLTGSLKKPGLLGNVTLDSVSFKIAATGTGFENVTGRIRMTGDTVFVDSIVGMAGGPVRVNGTVAVGNWREPSFDLALSADNAELMNNSSGDIHANADLQLTGALNKPSITGSVIVLNGVLYIPESRGKKLIGVGDPSLFSVIDTSMTLQRELFPAQSAMFRNLSVQVELSVQRNTWVRSRDANVEIFTDGAMSVNVLGDALTLTGALDADRGEYTFLSKRFQIKRGSALFIGTPDLNPTLQITAEYQVKQVSATATNIRVLIGGTVTSPRISLESDAQPPLSQSDLLSYLAFGERSSSLLQFNQTSLSPTGGNLLNVAGSRLAGIAVGVALAEVKGNAARSLGVDVFNITPGDLPLFSSGGGFNQFLMGTEIEAGRYVNPRTFVSVIATPGAIACSRGRIANSSCAPPGATITHRTSAGYRFDLSYSPRYFLGPPTLAAQSISGGGQLGAFVIREWRF